MASPQVILVTGCSSGIGRATAREAAARRHRVFATARRTGELSDIQRSGSLEEIVLDLTDPGSVRTAVDQVLASAGHIDALVNNAGYGQYGAIEEISAEQWRAQFDVNFFGAVEMIRAVLPAMRKAGRGTIVNVSSVAGKVVVPFAAPYSSVKHALEAMSDALRVEVSSFGVRVVLVEPGPIETRFAERARSEVAPFLNRPGPYRELYAGAERAMNGDFQKGRRPPEHVARVIVDAIESPHPRTRYRVTPMARLLIPLRPLLPDRLVDWMMRKSLGLPRPR